MKLIFALFLIVCTTYPTHSSAHTYWLVAEGSHKIKEPVSVKMYFGEYTTGEILKGKALDKMKDIKVLVRHQNSPDFIIEMKQDSGFWEGSFIPTKEGYYEITGLNDTREVQDWTKHGYGITRPVQYLKHIYPVGKVTTKQSTEALLDIVISHQSDSIFHLTIYKNKKPAANIKFFISTPEGEDTAYETDENGNVLFVAKKPGLYIAGLDWIDNSPGQFRGKEYKSIRHRLDASFYYKQ